jgi:hypothetical protein
VPGTISITRPIDTPLIPSTARGHLDYSLCLFSALLLWRPMSLSDRMMTMPKSRGAFEAGFGGETGDPVSSLMTTARDAWAIAISVLETWAQQTGEATARPGQETALDPLPTLLEALAGFAASLSNLVAPRAELGSGSPSSDIPKVEDLSSWMMQTWLICATSTLRYWRDLTGVYARYQPALIRSVATPQSLTPEGEDRVLADEVRACLREIGDVAVQEARRLQTELDRIGEAVYLGLEPKVSEFYQRRWKAKD